MGREYSLSLLSFKAVAQTLGQIVVNVSFIELPFIMQGHDDLEPIVRIRDLKKDRVNFVLENVDLACDHICR